MEQFREVIDECGFMDLGSMGAPFTWQKNFANGHSIWERLYRGMATNDWLIKFPGTRIYHLTSNSSDQCPLWIIPDGLEVASPSKPFQFKEMWLSDLGCSNVVEAMWSSIGSVDPSVKVMKKIEKRRKELKRWDHNHFRNVRQELEKKRKM